MQICKIPGSNYNHSDVQYCLRKLRYLFNRCLNNNHQPFKYFIVKSIFINAHDCKCNNFLLIKIWDSTVLVSMYSVY